ncbi:hypothetical protein IFR05_006775 [Cadophora sp. M221]|nr:hypothetical protein IFR05_006775 [Cadophora sp. M221]
MASNEYCSTVFTASPAGTWIGSRDDALSKSEDPQRLGPFTDRSDDVGPFPCAPVQDPRGPEPKFRPQYHFEYSAAYSVRCYQHNMVRAFIGKHGDGVRALAKQFSRNFFFHTRKSSRGGNLIWVEPRFPQMQESAEIKKQLDDAYKLIVEWANLPVVDLPAMDVFLEGYLARQNRPAASSNEGCLGRGQSAEDPSVTRGPTLAHRLAQTDKDGSTNPRKRARVEISDVENIPILKDEGSDSKADASITPTSTSAVSNAPTNAVEQGPASNHLKRAMELLDGEELRDNKRRRKAVPLVPDVSVSEESQPPPFIQLLHDQGPTGQASGKDQDVEEEL